MTAPVLSDTQAREIARGLLGIVGLAALPDLGWFCRTGGITYRLAEWADGYLAGSPTRVPSKQLLALYVRDAGNRGPQSGWGER